MSIELAAFVMTIQGEIESARRELDVARESEEKLDLRCKVLSALCGVARAKRDLEWHKILVGWVERQRQAIVSQSARSDQEAGNHMDQHQGRRSQSGIGRNRNTSVTSKPMRSSNDSGRGKRQAKARSIHGAFDPPRVSKAIEKKTPRRRQMTSFSHDASLPVEK